MLRSSLRFLLLGMAQSGGGCSAPLWGLASTAKTGPRLTGKKLGWCSCLADKKRRNRSGEGGKAGMLVV